MTASTATAAKVTLQLAGSPPRVHAKRGEGVPDSFWFELMMEWAADPTVGNANSQALCNLERVLSRMAWVGPAGRRDRVGLEISPELQQILRSTHAERKTLSEILNALPQLTTEQAEARLKTSRFTRPLRPFQLRDLAHLLSLPHGANFSVPGAGKTTVAYATYEAERTAGRVERLLVVAPLSAYDAWTSEVEVCFGDEVKPVVQAYNGDYIPHDAEILLVNYQRLAANYEDLSAWARAKPTMVLLDEAHRMKKGWDGQWGSACLSLAFLAVRRDLLTGTPAPQAPSDFVALIDFLWPGQARRVLPPEALLNPAPPGAGAAIASRIAPMFTRTKKAELGLPEVSIKAVPVPLEGLQATIYAALHDQYAGELRVSMSTRVELARMGDIVMYLLEAATNPKLLSAGSAGDDIFRHPPLDVPRGTPLWEVMQRYNQYETPAKFQVLLSMIKENADAGRKTLVWTNFVRNIKLLETMLTIYRPALIYGGMPSQLTQPDAERTRESELRRFRSPDNECMVLIANPASMSEGVSLHKECHDAIYLDRTFNAGHWLQSIDRIHRLGLLPSDETRIRYLVTAGTIDDVVDARIQIKAKNLAEALDDPSLMSTALPDEEAGTIERAVDSDDLQALFAHLRADPPGPRDFHD
ncbi:DEAD/DEAH box helicase [Actinoplanes sp. NPDC048988]|uniref:DEAD/DEAH box helicase n=1 Tax=Actinoplanes sp. NPDC048988 TaxID=3363901 RepID=UPI0037246F7F